MSVIISKYILSSYFQASSSISPYYNTHLICIRNIRKHIYRFEEIPPLHQCPNYRQATPLILTIAIWWWYEITSHPSSSLIKKTKRFSIYLSLSGTHSRDSPRARARLFKVHRLPRDRRELLLQFYILYILRRTSLSLLFDASSFGRVTSSDVLRPLDESNIHEKGRVYTHNTRIADVVSRKCQGCAWSWLIILVQLSFFFPFTICLFFTRI